MSVLNTNTRLLYPPPKSSAEVTPGRHRLNEDLETEMISPERRARVLGSPKAEPTAEPIAASEPEPEPVVKPSPLVGALNRIRRNLPTRWVRR